jgi:hypothetical protein
MNLFLENSIEISQIQFGGCSRLHGVRSVPDPTN